jgi:ArsR family metal-binding transcriptional regulator
LSLFWVFFAKDFSDPDKENRLIGIVIIIGLRIIITVEQSGMIIMSQTEQVEEQKRKRKEKNARKNEKKPKFLLKRGN